MLHGILFVCFAIGLPYAAAQVRKKQSSLVICGCLWLVKMVTPWLMLLPSHEESADRSVSGDFDQVGLCNPAKASSNTHLQRNIVQQSLTYSQGKDPSVRERGRPAEPSNFCKEITKRLCGHFMHRSDLTPLCTQWYNLSIIHWNN